MADVKILMVDDEERMRKLVKDFLSVKGYIVKEAADGEEALKMFMEDKELDLIILDVMMPKMDGFETLEAIRQYNKTIPCIMLTARSEEHDELKGFNLLFTQTSLEVIWMHKCIPIQDRFIKIFFRFRF
mgnify:CR=1 FL=1